MKVCHSLKEGIWCKDNLVQHLLRLLLCHSYLLFMLRVTSSWVSAYWQLQVLFQLSHSLESQGKFCITGLMEQKLLSSQVWTCVAMVEENYSYQWSCVTSGWISNTKFWPKTVSLNARNSLFYIQMIGERKCKIIVAVQVKIKIPFKLFNTENLFKLLML